MYRVDAALAVDANFQPRPRIADFSEFNQNSNSGMSFGDYLNSYLRTTIDNTQAQLTKTHAASFLAWYYPPVMISPKTEEKLEEKSKPSTD